MKSLFRDNGMINEFHYAYWLCAPSRVSILTGRFVHHSDTFQDGWTCSGAGKGFRTIGENLRDHNYLTHWIGSAPASRARPRPPAHASSSRSQSATREWRTKPTFRETAASPRAWYASTRNPCVGIPVV